MTKQALYLADGAWVSRRPCFNTRVPTPAELTLKLTRKKHKNVLSQPDSFECPFWGEPPNTLTSSRPWKTFALPRSPAAPDCARENPSSALSSGIVAQFGGASGSSPTGRSEGRKWHGNQCPGGAKDVRNRLKQTKTATTTMQKTTSMTTIVPIRRR